MLPFTEKEIEMVTDFAAQATIALEATRRERQLRELQTALAHSSHNDGGNWRRPSLMNSSNRLRQ